MSTRRHQLASVVFFAWVLAQLLPQVVGFGWPILWSSLLSHPLHDDPSGALRLVFPANAIVTALAYVPVVLAARGLTTAALDEAQAGLARGASVALLVSAVTSLASCAASAVLYVVPGPHDPARAAGDLGSLGLLVAFVAVLADVRAARVPASAALATVVITALAVWTLADDIVVGVVAVAGFVVSRALLWLGLRRARPAAPLGPSLREVFS